MRTYNVCPSPIDSFHSALLKNSIEAAWPFKCPTVILSNAFFNGDFYTDNGNTVKDKNLFLPKLFRKELQFGRCVRGGGWGWGIIMAIFFFSSRSYWSKHNQKEKGEMMCLYYISAYLHLEKLPTSYILNKLLGIWWPFFRTQAFSFPLSPPSRITSFNTFNGHG